MSKFKVGDHVWCLTHGRGKVTDIIAPYNILAGGLEVEAICGGKFLRFTDDGYARRSDHAPSLYHLTEIGEVNPILSFIQSKDEWRKRALLLVFALIILTLLANGCIAVTAEVFHLQWWCDALQAFVLVITGTICIGIAGLFYSLLYSLIQAAIKRS